MRVGDSVKSIKGNYGVGAVKSIRHDGICVVKMESGLTYECHISDIKLDENLTDVIDKQNKYKRTVPSTTIDIYDVLQAWEVTNPAIQHAIKKLLQPGQRGHKTREEDLQEALVSIERAIELDRK